MRFSVIITTCKREPDILKEAIDSVINQTYKDIELIVVNDAPSYEGRSDIDALIASYGERIQYYVNQNQRGANYARNLGAEASQGQILSFLDDDDYWDYQRIEKVVEKIRDGADIVYTDMYMLKGNKLRYFKMKKKKDDEILEAILAENYLGGFSNVSFTREIFERAGRLDEAAPSYQDQDLFIRMVSKGIIGYIPEPLSYYRITDNSISLNSQKKYNGLIKLLDKYKELYDRYPKSKRIKLENDMVYACRNGWKTEAKSIVKMLYPLDSKGRIAILYGLGTIKRFLLEVVRLYARIR